MTQIFLSNFENNGQGNQNSNEMGDETPPQLYSFFGLYLQNTLRNDTNKW
jgi:hypothetical protein